jgi:hypothetical protein
MVSVLAIEPNVRGFKPGQGRWIFKNDTETSFGEKQSYQPHVVRFYGMLKILTVYDDDDTSAKLKDISRQLPPSPLDVSAAARELRWMNQE